MTVRRQAKQSGSHDLRENPVSLSKLYIGVAFHGIELTGAHLKFAYESLLVWQTKTAGAEPTHGVIYGRGSTERIITFKVLKARLLKSDVKHLTGFDLFTLAPDRESPMWQHSVQAHVSNNYRRIVLSASSSLTSLGLEGELLDVTRTLLALAAPRYGYVFFRDKSIRGHAGGTALCYGMGIPTVSLEHALEKSDETPFLQEWRLHVEKLRLYDKGILRDLYRWNFLNEAQLRRKVERKQLRNWIAADPSRGELQEIEGPLQLWMLTDEQIANVRPVLWDAGVLFNWRDYRDP